MDALAGADETPVGTLLRHRLLQAREPRERGGNLAAVLELDQEAVTLKADAGRQRAESCREAAALAAWVTCKSRFIPPPIVIPGAENPYSTTLDAIFGIVPPSDMGK